MALFNINILDRSNLPPDQLGRNSITVPYENPYVFTKANFTTETTPQYSDPEGDEPSTLKFTVLNLKSHQLLFNGIEVLVNDEISFTDIDINNLLQFIPDSNIITGDDGIYFDFDIADEGSNTYSELTNGRFDITVNKQINQPPSSVGDAEETVDEGDTIVFTTTMFTDTIPQYSDPEGDNAFRLKIVTLPTKGIIYLDGIPVLPGAKIDFTDISNNLLTFVPNSVEQNEIDNFEFKIADSGSNIFIG